MNNAEQKLVDELKPVFLSAGFKWLKARQMFVRKQDFGFFSVSWASYSTHENGGQLVLTPLLGVRHDIVEDVVNELGLIYGDDNKKYTMTVDRGLGFFPFNNQKDYKQYIRPAFVDGDVQVAARNIASIFDEDGQEFFSRYASLLECSRGLNDPIDSISHQLCNNFPRRAYSGVASAFFAESYRVPQLLNQYLKFAERVQPNQCEQIAERLEKLVAVASAIK